MSGKTSTGMRAWLSLATVGLLLVILAGCVSAPQQSDQEIMVDFGQEAVQHALDMVGTPYRFGGNTSEGFDCSGLVQYSYARAGVELPRTMEGQWAVSRPVTDTQLRPGDLLFFHQEGKRNSHMGIYIGDDRFVHAPSTGKQVTIASLANRYWRRHFSVARRLFADVAGGGL